MNAEQIRALYVETLARAEFAHFCKVATWEEADESDRQTWMPNAERAVDALAEAGLLPTRVEESGAIPVYSDEETIAYWLTNKRRYKTEWQEVGE